ncbi:MAG: sugar transferase [Mesorhizobium sp.]
MSETHFAPFVPLPLGGAASTAHGGMGARLSRQITQFALAMGDAGAFTLAYLVLTPFSTPIGGMDFARIAILVATAVIVLHVSAKLYPGYRLQPCEQLRRRVLATCKVAALAVFAAMLLTEQPQLALFIVTFLALGLIGQPVTRWIAMQACRRLGLWGERAVILAGPNRAPALTDYFTRNWQHGLRPVPAGATDMPGSTEACIAVIADETLLTTADLTTARRHFSEIVLLADTPYFKVAGLRPADIDGQFGLRLATGEQRADSALTRRAADLAIAIPAVLVSAPLLLLAAAAVYLVDPGPVFFRQPREGLAGRTIRILKLRTMYRDAEQRLEALLATDTAARAEWSTHFKLKHDPRILPVVGHLLRSTSLDELPQLVNVIAGDMGIVGPRPFPEYHLNAMNAEFRHRRRSVTPGLTGLWQISERSDADLELQRQLDEFYIDNRSPWFDGHIVLRTIPAIFRRSGA